MADPEQIPELKTRLRLLNSLLDSDLVDDERRRLAAERDDNPLDGSR